MSRQIPPATPMPSPGPRAPLTPTRRDWIFFCLLVVAGGSSFSAIRVAVETAPPGVVGSARLLVAALFLYGYMRATGRGLDPLLVAGRPNRSWLYAAACGAAGYAVPMYLFPYAQQTVPSLLAGIYMAFMPLVTVILAALFADERLTSRKIWGTLIGLGGVLLLIGPGALSGLLSADVIAQGALLLATTGYAVSGVLTRNAPQRTPARSFAAMVMICGAAFSLPTGIAAAATDDGVSDAGRLAILYLGLVPTALNTILIIHMVRSAGAGFLALANYVTPAAAIAFGVALFAEALAWQYVIGLGVILTGVFTAQPGPLLAMLRRVRRGKGDLAAQIGDARPAEEDPVPTQGASDVPAPRR